MARRRPTVAQVRALEEKVSRLQAQHERERRNLECFGKEITCRIFSSGSRYDYDDSGKKLERLPDPEIGDVIIAEFWYTWMGGSDPSGFKIAVRVTAKPESGVCKGTSLSSYVRPLGGRDFYAFDSKSTRAIRQSRLAAA